MRILLRVIPLALALTLAGQPVGELVCGVSCEAEHMQPQAAPRSEAHACHDAVSATGASAQSATVVRDDVPGHAFVAGPCRQLAAAIDEDACVWTRETCPTLVSQKTTVVPPIATLLAATIDHALDISPTPPPAEDVSRDVSLRLATALRL